MFKNLLLRNHKGDEAETWHTCLGLYISYVFHSGRIRTLVAMATYSSQRLKAKDRIAKKLLCFTHDLDTKHQR